MTSAASDRDVGARGHGHADIGLGQRGRVVDAVANHRDLTALGLQPLHRLHLSGRQHLGNHLGDAGVASDRRGSGGAIAAQHHHAEAQLAEAPHHVGGIGAQRVGQRDDASWPPVDRHQHRGEAAAGRIVGQGGEVSRADAFVLQERRIAHRHVTQSDGARAPRPGTDENIDTVAGASPRPSA